MDSQNPLINIGELAKPAAELINRISEAIGMLYLPTHIREVAKAEADAEKTRANTQIEINEMQVRAFRRLIAEEGIKQKNIESIALKALPLIDEDAQPKAMTNDWIMNFFDKSKFISDDEMQVLWARILAGEANSPGIYSRRTVNLLSSLEKYEAGLFTNLCSFGLQVEDIKLQPLIYDENHRIYKSLDINYLTLAHLQDVGLINVYSRNNELEVRDISMFNRYVYYFGEKIFVRPTNGILNVGHVTLTSIGEELSQICDRNPVDGFIDYVISVWSKLGYGVPYKGPIS